MAGDANRPKLVFDACRFAFVCSRNLLPKTIAELSRAAKKYGGEALEPAADGSLPLAQATHIISNSIDFEQYDAALEAMLPVVSSSWISASLERNRLAPIRPFSPDPRMIFSQVNLTCADIPGGDKEAITGAVLALGGTESKDLTRLTTHICALSMDHDKCKEAAANPKVRCKIVLPHWFDDCFKLGKRIDETPYLLPDPPILRRLGGAGLGGAGAGDANDKIPIPESASLEGATTADPDAPPVLDEKGWRSNLTVFQNKKVILSGDLVESQRFRSVVVDLIGRGGGTVLGEGRVGDCSNDLINACDMYICRFRDGRDYVRASRRRKDVGNLAWLFHMITTNEWCSPLRRLLHYPVPRNGIDGCADFAITVSNYGGEARSYLENLVTAAGAKFTKTMRMENTHLITATNESEKCHAASDWNIPMVNHLWIEESYARCKVQSVTNPRYTTFPSRTNLGEVIGQTFFDEKHLREHYYPDSEIEGSDEDVDEDVDMDSAEIDQTDQVEQEVETDQTDQPVEPKSQPLLDVSNEQMDVDQAMDDESTSSEAEEEPAPAPAPAPAASRGRRANKTTVSTPSRTPGRPRQSVGKENEPGPSGASPFSVGSASRSAKDKALSKLHGLAPDIALYEKEKIRSKRDGSAPFGGKRAAKQIDKAASEASEASRRKRRSSASGDDGDDGEPDSAQDSDDEGARPPKKSRPSLPPVQMRVVLTGYQRWLSNNGKEEAERRKLRGLGIQIVQETQPCDYLAAPALVRTMKFLRTLARGPKVINSQFLDDVLDQGALLDPDDYTLVDAEGEKRFGVNLARAMARARSHRGRLLWNVVVYCAQDITNGPGSYRVIAEANGAIFKTFRMQSGTTIKPVAEGEEETQPPEPVYLLTSATAGEKPLWPKFEQMALEGNMAPRIVAPDWLLDVAMRQELAFDERYLAVNFFKK